MILFSSMRRWDWARADRRAKILWVLALIVLLLIHGCGRKGPPVAPRITEPIAVTDLSAKVEGQTVVLSWSAPAGSDAALPGGYRVYRARLAVQDCEGCPLLFQKIVDLEVHQAARPTSGQPWIFSWKDAVAVGFRYVYKVSAYGDGYGTVDSNLVNVRP